MERVHPFWVKSLKPMIEQENKRPPFKPAVQVDDRLTFYLLYVGETGEKVNPKHAL